ncbi:MAG: CPBP family intramembrane metalloprotease [Planctomycetes bacterium]|nr:CPBP family intramembrane metalloprotease [Planctomycetota bacterium]
MAQEDARTNKTASLGIETYLRESRRVSVSLIYVTPLLLLHEVLLRAAGGDTRNAVEQAFKDLFWYLGPAAGWLHAFLVLVVVAAVCRVVALRLPCARLFPAFLVECLLLALLLGPVVAFVTGPLELGARVPGGPSSLEFSLLASISAGIYEELLFRLMVLGGLYVLALRLFGVARPAAFLLALLVSAFAFAWYHHAAPYGEPYEPRAFAFRAIAGILLGLVFAGRGLAVVVYLHAMYDVLYDLRIAAAGW